MAMDYKQLSGRAKGYLANFSAGQKATVVVAVLALLVGGLTFSKWASKPSYAPLFTNLESADAAAITEKLTASKVPYQLADGGHTIMVPAGSVYQERLNMSAAGLPQGNTGGYALLDKQGITTSEFRQHIDYQRAMEGEMARTIEAIDGVSAASVHLVIPPDDLFSDTKRQPSASVLVKTIPGKSLSTDQVQAVVHLVSSSIEGLDPGQVTVADAKGTVLAAPGQDGFPVGAAAGGGRDQQTQDFQGALEAKVASMLDRVLGPGHAVVQVNATLGFDQRNTHTEQYVTSKQVPVLSEQTTSEKFDGGSPTVGGVLGTGPSPVSGGSANSKYDRKNTTRDFGVGKVTEDVKAAPGQVQRLSVAVLLDQNAKGANPTTVQQVVAAATGLDPKRGDTIQVTQMPFDTSAAKQAADELAKVEKERKRTELLSAGRTGGTVLIVLVVVLLALRSLRKAAAPVRTTVVIPPAERTDLPGRELADPVDQPAVSAPSARAIAAAAPESERRANIQQEVGELIERQPDEVAQLLRGWLADRRS